MLKNIKNLVLLLYPQKFWTNQSRNFGKQCNTNKRFCVIFFLIVTKNVTYFQNKPWNFHQKFSSHKNINVFNTFAWIIHYDKDNKKRKAK